MGKYTTLPARRKVNKIYNKVAKRELLHTLIGLIQVHIR
jgi:hypothetical protein